MATIVYGGVSYEIPDGAVPHMQNEVLRAAGSGRFGWLPVPVIEVGQVDVDEGDVRNLQVEVLIGPGIPVSFATAHATADDLEAALMDRSEELRQHAASHETAPG